MSRPIYIMFFTLLSQVFPSDNAPLSQCVPKCDCYNKEMKCIDQHLTSVPKWNMGTFMELLDLSFNDFVDLFNNSFLDFPKIKDIYLNSADIRWVETNAFHGLLYLEKLDLSNNYIEYIEPSTFVNNKNLQTVILSKNMLQLQDEPLLISATIVNLDLSQCEISYLPNNVLSGLPGLQTLDLSYNSLSYLSPDTFATQSNLNIIDVSNNDWKCDHNFDTLMCWIYQHTAEHDKISTTFCYDKKENKQTWTVNSCSHTNSTDYSTMAQYTTTQHTQSEQQSIIQPKYEQTVVTEMLSEREDNFTNIAITETLSEQEDNFTNIALTETRSEQEDNFTNTAITETLSEQEDNFTNTVITETLSEQEDNSTNILITEAQFGLHTTFWLIMLIGLIITGRWIYKKLVPPDTPESQVVYHEANTEDSEHCT